MRPNANKFLSTFFLQFHYMFIKKRNTDYMRPPKGSYKLNSNYTIHIRPLWGHIN